MFLVLSMPLLYIISALKLHELYAANELFIFWLTFLI